MIHTGVFESAESIVAFQDSARDFLQSKAPLTRLRKLRGSAPGFTRDLWRSIAEAGWTTILVPEADGGLGLGLRVACAIGEEVGRNPVSEPYIAGAVQSVTALQAVPTSALKGELNAKLALGDALLGLAWQEQLGQMDPVPIQTIPNVEPLHFSGEATPIAYNTSEGTPPTGNGPALASVSPSASVTTGPMAQEPS